jgi:DNA-binding transcriptional regulator YiaG
MTPKGAKMSDNSNGEKLKKMIRELHMDYAFAADYLGVSERTLFRWMAGDTKFPRAIFLALELYNTGR